MDIIVTTIKQIGRKIELDGDTMIGYQHSAKLYIKLIKDTSDTNPFKDMILSGYCTSWKSDKSIPCPIVEKDGSTYILLDGKVFENNGRVYLSLGAIDDKKVVITSNMLEMQVEESNKITSSVSPPETYWQIEVLNAMKVWYAQSVDAPLKEILEQLDEMIATAKQQLKDVSTATQKAETASSTATSAATNANEKANLANVVKEAMEALIAEVQRKLDAGEFIGATGPVSTVDGQVLEGIATKKDIYATGWGPQLFSATFLGDLNSLAGTPSRVLYYRPGTTNYPGDLKEGYLFNINYSTSAAYTKQIAFDINVGSRNVMLIRSCVNGVWTPWVKMASEEDLKKFLPLTGGTLSNNLIFHNTKGVYVKDTNGSMKNLATLTSANVATIGDLSVPTQIRSSVVPVWHDGTKAKQLVATDSSITIDYDSTVDAIRTKVNATTDKPIYNAKIANQLGLYIISADSIIINPGGNNHYTLRLPSVITDVAKNYCVIASNGDNNTKVYNVTGTSIVAQSAVVNFYFNVAISGNARLNYAILYLK